MQNRQSYDFIVVVTDHHIQLAQAALFFGFLVGFFNLGLSPLFLLWTRLAKASRKYLASSCSFIPFSHDEFTLL